MQKDYLLRICAVGAKVQNNKNAISQARPFFGDPETGKSAECSRGSRSDVHELASIRVRRHYREASEVSSRDVVGNRGGEPRF